LHHVGNAPDAPAEAWMSPDGTPESHHPLGYLLPICQEVSDDDNTMLRRVMHSFDLTPLDASEQNQGGRPGIQCGGTGFADARCRVRTSDILLVRQKVEAESLCGNWD
jgi:hypothetical protein